MRAAPELLAIPTLLESAVNAEDLPSPEREHWMQFRRRQAAAKRLQAQRREWERAPSPATADHMHATLCDCPELAEEFVRNPPVQMSWKTLLRFAVISPSAAYELAQSATDSLVLAFGAKLDAAGWDELDAAGWDELRRTVCRSPKAAYQYARLRGTALESEAGLAELAAAVRHHPFWQAAFNIDLRGADPTEVLAELRPNLAYSPSAAAAALVLCPVSDVEQELCVAGLRLSPEWCFAAAWLLCKPTTEDPLRSKIVYTELRKELLRTPQWAYHWHTLIDDCESLEGLDHHAGWTMQMLFGSADIKAASMHETLASKMDAVSDRYHTNDVYYTAFIFWAADIVSEWNKQESPVE